MIQLYVELFADHGGTVALLALYKLTDLTIAEKVPRTD